MTVCGSVTGIQWMEVKDASYWLTVYKTAPFPLIKQYYLVQSVINAPVENTCFK